MKVQTKEDALLHCFDLWLWLSLNPKKLKLEWPGWKDEGGYLEKCLHECPACDYVARKCSRCILKWGKENCYSNDGPYQKWREARGNYKERSRLALKIAILALEALTEEVQMELKCSCGWESEPTESLNLDKHGQYRCPNCDTVFTCKSLINKSFKPQYCAMCQWIEKENDKIPVSLKKQIRSKKGKFYGKLVKAVLKAGAYPKWFLPNNMKYITIEGLLNSLTSNNIEFKIFFKGEEQ